MEQLIAEIRSYASARGIKPATVLQSAAGFSGTTWDKWINAGASCSLKSAERIRNYMRMNPAPAPVAAEAASDPTPTEEDAA